jgi:hypothetical protein
MATLNRPMKQTARLPWDSVADEPAPPEMLNDFEAPTEPAAPKSRGEGWALAAMCLGLSIVAACVLIPQADANRRLLYERQKLTLDKDQIDRQVAVNAEFLKKVADDPQLAERLAERQLRVIRQGTKVIPLKADFPDEMSPYLLVSIPPPAPMAPYRPVGGFVASLCLNPRTHIYLMGAALLLLACGLVLGDRKCE